MSRSELPTHGSAASAGTAARGRLSTPGISPEPEPAIVFKGLGAHSLDFGVRAWTNDFGDWVTIRTEMTRVYEALRREKIEIPFPQQDLHLRSVAPAVVELLARTRSEMPGPTPASCQPPRCHAPSAPPPA